MAGLNFDANSVTPSKSFAPIPAGVYPAQIVESEMRPLKSGNGDALALQFEILGQSHAGRRIFANLNIRHNNKDAERISQEQLSAICHAVGVTQVRDSSQLHNKPLNIRVKIRKQDGYEDRNEVSGFEPAPGGQTFSAPAAASQQADSQQETPRKPWEK